MPSPLARTELEAWALKDAGNLTSSSSPGACCVALSLPLAFSGLLREGLRQGFPSCFHLGASSPIQCEGPGPSAGSGWGSQEMASGHRKEPLGLSEYPTPLRPVGRVSVWKPGSVNLGHEECISQLGCLGQMGSGGSCRKQPCNGGREVWGSSGSCLVVATGLRPQQAPTLSQA